MRDPRWILLASLALVAASGCRKPPPSARTPEGTLALLRASLATGNPAIERVSDVRLLSEARALLQARELQDRIGVPITTSGVNLAIGEHAPETDPQRAFAGVLPMLGSGHCVRIGDAPVPDLIRPVPEPGEHWPQRVLDMQVSVARRAQNAIAGDYRCDGGPSFGAVFSHPFPDDGTLRVALIAPSRHR
ncbi:MAG: hypothetical protein WCJ30_08460 [Deltaproteobacteria bacterium]